MSRASSSFSQLPTKITGLHSEPLDDNHMAHRPTVIFGKIVHDACRWDGI